MSSPREKAYNVVVDNVIEMQEEELINFIKETVGQLNTLADRLEVYAQGKGTSAGLQNNEEPS